MMKKIVVVIILILLALIAWKKDALLSLQPQQGTTSSINQQVTNVKLPEGWKKHENKELGVNFATPADYEFEKNGDYSILATPPSNNQDKVGHARFFYVSVVPASLSNDDSGQIYNYSSSFYKKLLAIPVGEIKNLSDIEGQKDWYMYERAGDEIFNGKTAKVFVNQRPWEFPNGTWEYRYIFELPEKTVITGAYIEGGPSDAPFTLPVLQQIMDTLTINK